MSDSNRNTKNLIEILGVSAVLLGLVFVGLELRQNTAAVQAATMQGLSDASQEYLLTIASDPQLTEILEKGRIDPDQLNFIEERRFWRLERSQWIRFQNAYMQFRRGTMGEEDWGFYERLVCANSSGKATWHSQRDHLSASFVNFVENCWAEE